MNAISDINLLSDKAILSNIGLFIQQTRIKQNLTQEELAARAAISRSTLSLVERGDTISLVNLIKLLRILNALYIFSAFEITEEISPLQLAKGEKQKRKRASRNTPDRSKNPDMEW